MKSVSFGQERDMAAKRRRGGKHGNRQRIVAGKQAPIKMHPAHTITDQGIEIGGISAATRHPDGSRRA